MKIRALVIVGSFLHSTWTNANFIKREFMGAKFIRVRGGQYIAENVINVIDHPCILLEMQSLDIKLPEVVTETEETDNAPRRGRPKKIV